MVIGSPAMIVAISFDVWNTLLKLDTMFNAIARSISKHIGIDIDTARRALTDCYAESKKLVREGIVDGYRAVEESQHILAKKLGVDVETVKRAIVGAVMSIDIDSLLFPDTLEALEKLAERGFKMGVIGNTLIWPSSYTRFLLEKCGIAKFFRAQLYADEIGISKPDRRIFLHLCRSLGVEPQQTVHVGDSLSEDIGGALSAGMKAILIRRDSVGYTIVKEIGLAIVSNLKQVLEATTYF